MDGTLLNKKYKLEERVTALEEGSGYELPIASASTLGGVKIGENLEIDESGVLSASGGGSEWSSTETVAGTWNGKTLYRRLFTFQTHGEDWNTTLDAETPVDFAVMEFGYIYAETGGEKRYININTYQGSVWAFGYAGVQDDRIHFYDRRSGNLLSDKYATVSILYTKKEVSTKKRTSKKTEN